MSQKSVILAVFLCLFTINYALADDAIPITLSSTMDQVVFDGKWSFETEWKQTTLYILTYDDDRVILRVAHQGDFVYVMIDALDDTVVNHDDKATVCFDTGNEKNTIPDSNDYCFVSLMGSNGVTYQGDEIIHEGDNFKIVPNHEGFITAGAVSDENDRYSTIPHASYEFRIPTDLIGRNSVYGFYLSVYDSSMEKYYSYPVNATATNMIVPPSKWGTIYSPDKSLPEFNLPLILLISALAGALYLTSKYNLHVYKP
ncbi:MAG TPA: hypothetical protein VNK44_07000 [Candidatus Nitrosotenuis sp.]|nr:hypothetical protein [Candidatus Nitrosotenuis sp.]